MWNLLIPAITTILEKIIPDPKASADAKLELLKLAQAGELAALDAEMKLALGQIDVNKAEASTDLFRGGWRPFAGWVCGIGLGYNFLVRPLLPWIVNALGGDVPALPEIDINTLMGLLFGMLGLGGLRTFEKLKGKA